jgi:hypothetical protein
MTAPTGWPTENGPFDANDPAHRLYTPAEVAALVAAGQEAMREACAAHIEAVREWAGQDHYCDSCKGGAIYPDREDEARRVRALPLPDAPGALARMIAEAEVRGMERAAGMAALMEAKDVAAAILTEAAAIRAAAKGIKA